MRLYRRPLRLESKAIGQEIAPAPSLNNRSEFAAIETAAEELDQLTPDQQRQAVTVLASMFKFEVTADYKPPSGGFTRKRKFSRG